MKGLVALVLGFALAGCGSSSGGGTSSGVDTGKRIDSLTADEKAKVCDWLAAKYGGYGATKSCGADLTLEAPASQAECVAENFPTPCAATVGQGEACENATSCENPIPEACAPIVACFLGGGV